MSRADSAQNNNLARRREEELMRLLAQLAAGDMSVISDRDDSSLWQLGYAASLVRGCLDDPEDNLGAAIRLAADVLEDKPQDAIEFVGGVQARWGAPRHLDAAKLRLETPLHLLGLRRGEEESG